jgi:hypothetical protein
MRVSTVRLSTVARYPHTRCIGSWRVRTAPSASSNARRTLTPDVLHVGVHGEGGMGDVGRPALAPDGEGRVEPPGERTHLAGRGRGATGLVHDGTHLPSRDPVDMIMASTDCSLRSYLANSDWNGCSGRGAWVGDLADREACKCSCKRIDGRPHVEGHRSASLGVGPTPRGNRSAELRQGNRWPSVPTEFEQFLGPALCQLAGAAGIPRRRLTHPQHAGRGAHLDVSPGTGPGSFVRHFSSNANAASMADGRQRPVARRALNPRPTLTGRSLDPANPLRRPSPTDPSRLRPPGLETGPHGERTDETLSAEGVRSVLDGMRKQGCPRTAIPRRPGSASRRAGYGGGRRRSRPAAVCPPAGGQWARAAAGRRTRRG